MQNRVPLAVVLVFAACLIPGHLFAQAEDAHASRTNPLAGFERLVGGQWHLDGSYQEFEWGVGRRSIIARNYFVVEGKPRLVAQGMWYWHPEEKSIKGIFTAIDMGIEVFEYTTRFEDNRIVSELVTYDAMGTPSMYLETWEFADEAHFVWTLFAATPEGLKEAMSGTYARRQK